MYFLFGRHISFSSFMPITFEIVHTCISIQKTNVPEVLSYTTNVLHLYATSVPSHL